MLAVFSLQRKVQENKISLTLVPVQFSAVRRERGLWYLVAQVCKETRERQRESERQRETQDSGLTGNCLGRIIMLWECVGTGGRRVWQVVA